MFGDHRYNTDKPLCFIDPADAIRVIIDSVGREARRQLIDELMRAWIDELPEDELNFQYSQAVEDLDHQDLSLLAAWHATLDVGAPVASREFLMRVFPRLGEGRREALKLATGFKGEEAFAAGVNEEEIVDRLLPVISPGRCRELVEECIQIYSWDRLGTNN